MKKRLIALLSVCSIVFTSVFSSSISVYADIFDEDLAVDDFAEGDDNTSDDAVGELIEFTKEGREIIYWKENIREQGGFYEICGDWLYYVDPEKYCLNAINTETEKKVKITDYPVANLNVYDYNLYYTDLSESLMDVRLDPTALTDVTLGGKLYRMEEADSPSRHSEPYEIGEEGMVYYDLAFDEDGFFCLEGYEGLMGKDLEYAKLNEDGEQIGSLSLAPEDEIVKSYEQDGYVYLEVDHIDPETGDNGGYILKFDRDNGTGSREFIFGEDLHAYNGDINYISTLDSYLYQIPDGYAEARRISVTPVSTYNIDEGTIFAISAVGNVAVVIAEEDDIEPFAISTTAPAGGMTNYIEPVTRSDDIYEEIQENAEQVLKNISDIVDEQISKAEHALEIAHVRVLNGDYDGFAEEWENEKVRVEAQEKAKFVGPSEDTGTILNSITTTPIDSAKGATKITGISTMPIDRSEPSREDYFNYREELVEQKTAEMEKELEAVPEVRAELAKDRRKLAKKNYGDPLPSFLKGWDEFDETKADDYQDLKVEEAIELARKQGIEEGYVDLLDPRLYESINKKNNTGSGSTAVNSDNNINEDSNVNEENNEPGVDPCLAVEILLTDICSEAGAGCGAKYYDSNELPEYYSAYSSIFKDGYFDVRSYDVIGVDAMLSGYGIADSDRDRLWNEFNDIVRGCLARCNFFTSLVETAPDGSKALVRVNLSNYLAVTDKSAQELFDNWSDSVGYGMDFIYSTNTDAILSFTQYLIENAIYNAPGEKTYDVMVYSHPTLGWVCDVSDEPGMSVTQILYPDDAKTYSGSLSGGESGGAPSGSSAAGEAVKDEASSESSAATDSPSTQEETVQDENIEHYNRSEEPDFSPNSLMDNIRNVELEKTNGDKVTGYMSVPFSRPNTVKIKVVDRKGIDHKNALDNFLDSLFGFKPNTFTSYSDIYNNSEKVQNTERVVLDNSLPGKRPVEIMVNNDVVVEKDPRPISDTLSDIKDSMINAVKNKYEELYSKVTGTPINQEVYDPNYHFPPSYVDDKRLPLTVLPEKERDARQADKIKALEDQMRKEIQKSIQKENERKKKEAAGEEIIDVTEYFKQPQRRN